MSSYYVKTRIRTKPSNNDHAHDEKCQLGMRIIRPDAGINSPVSLQLQWIAQNTVMDFNEEWNVRQVIQKVHNSFIFTIKLAKNLHRLKTYGKV